MPKKIFIDGQDGTTGLGIRERLAGRADLKLLEISLDQRKNPAAKREILSDADLAILCLPDDAAKETVALAAGLDTKIIDASTAHRTDADFVYGLPELTKDQRRAIQGARRVANPGCYPTGFLLALRPLVDAGILPPDYPLSVHALSGYSGGGKKMILDFKEHDHSGSSPDWSVRPYALSLHHKHVPEMRVFANLAHSPLFSPAVGNYYQGMIVSIPLFTRALARSVTASDVRALLAARYEGERFVRVMPEQGDAPPALSPTTLNGTNDLELFVFGGEAQILLVARLDNLGKGASGAAVQNLNLMLGCDETSGLG